MYLIITNPKQHDCNSLFMLTQDTDIRSEFSNLNFLSIQNVKHYIQYWDEINNRNELEFLRLIKYSNLNVGQTSTWHDSNSMLLGFISNNDYVSYYTNCKTTLNYAVSSKYRNRGILTHALNMTIERMKSEGYNFAAAYVKHNNIPSIRVLEKCDFQKDKENPFGITYIKQFHKVVG